MKRIKILSNKITAIWILTLFLLIVFLVNPVTSLNNINNMRSGSITEKKNWTFMMYEDGDFYDTSYIILPGLDFARLSHAHSGKNLNVITLQDTFYAPGKLWYVNEHGGRRLLKNLGEVNMGNYKTLRDFVIYCKENFPAEHYILDIYDHGGGWTGACQDETNNGWLTMKDIRKALTEAGEVDIISFIVPCLMSTVESVYELRDCAEVYIGKEPNGHSSLQVVGPLCDLLNDEFYLSNIDIGKRIIDFFKEKVDVFPWSIFTGKALSAMRTDEVTSLVKAINNLSIILTNNIDKYIDDIRLVGAKTESFPTRRSGASDNYKARSIPELRHIDIYDFAKNYLEINSTNDTLRNCLQEVMEDVNRTVIAENHTNDHPDAHGLSIYFPDVLLINVSGDAADDYVNSGLDFTTNTSWDEFLIKYHSFYATVDDDGDADYKSIQKAIDNSSNGSAVYVKNGVYHENIVISKSITLVGESSDATIIDGGQNRNAVTITADGTMLFFLGIRNSSDSGGTGVSVRANSTIIRKCNIYDNYLGIYITNSSNNKILTNNISDNYCGIYLICSNKNKFWHNNLKDNKIDASFSDSSNNNWKNIYLEHPQRRINIIFGSKSIGNISIPWININRFPKFHK